MAIASLVLGIASVALGWLGLLWILGVVGIILGAIALKKLKADGQPTGMATAGLILSIIGTAYGSIVFFACTCTACLSLLSYGDLSDLFYLF